MLEHLGTTKLKLAEAKDEAEYRAQLAALHQRWRALAEYLEQRHQDGLIGYQVVTERSMLAPLDPGD
jgi:hypothetical protein